MSFLESLAGNAAITAEGLIGSRIAQNNALEQEDRRSANSLANQKSMAQFNEELAASRAATIEALKVKANERNAEIYNKAADAAPAAGDERRFQRFKADIGQTDATEDQLRAVFDNQYNQRSVGNFGGADRYVDPESANRMDIVNELRKGSAPATMVRSAQDDYKASLLDETNRRKLDAKERDAEENERSNRAREGLRHEQTMAMMSRIGGGGGAKEGESKFTSAINSAQRNLSVTEEKTAKRFREPTPAESMNPTKLQAYQNEKNIFIDGNAEVKAQRERVAALRDKEARELLGNNSAPPGKDKPVDASSALTDAKRAIAKNPANRAEVIRRLEAAGISTKGL